MRVTAFGASFAVRLMISYRVPIQPSAIARATGSLTAPCCSKRAGGTPSSRAGSVRAGQPMTQAGRPGAAPPPAAVQRASIIAGSPSQSTRFVPYSFLPAARARWNSAFARCVKLAELSMC